MSEQFEDPELQQRLDRAFQGSRPRRGFEDELLSRIQARRPLLLRLRDALTARMLQPALTTVAVLVIVGGLIFLVAHNFHPVGLRGGASSSTAAGPAKQDGAPGAPGGIRGAAGPTSSDAFGQVPIPQATVTTDYPGALDLRIATALPPLPANLPVYRYIEPDAAAAAAFARAHGAPTQAPASASSTIPIVGQFSGLGEEITVLGTDSANLVGPTYLIDRTPSAPVASPGTLTDIAAVNGAQSYLGTSKLAPAGASPTVRSGPDGAQVFYKSVFTVLGYGTAEQVDARGHSVGTTVSLRGDGQVFQASGPLGIDAAGSNYPPATTASVQLRLGARSQTGGTPVQVNLTVAQLVYVAVPAPPGGLFEPAWLLTGTFQAGGATHQVTVVVSALDTSRGG